MKWVTGIMACLCLVLASGCSVLKNKLVQKADSSFVKREKLETSMVLKERTDSEFRMVYTDSGKHTFVVEISPEGEFIFSPLSGYKGKAKVLRVSGDWEGWQRRLGAVSLYQALDVDSFRKNETKTQLEVSARQTEVVSEKSVKWYVWMLIGAVIIIIFCLIIRGRMYP